jgi:NADH:ubiquinone oxidoreductase subunit 6 (subunit J)
MNSFVIALYDLSAYAGALFLAFVLRQALNDMHIGRTDPQWIQNARRNAFISAAAFLFLTIYFQPYWLEHPSVITVGLVCTGLMLELIWVLAVSVISLRLRAPPKGQTGTQAVSDYLWRRRPP